MQEWNASSPTGKPFERTIIIDPSTSEDEKSNILSTICQEGYLDIKSLDDDLTTYLVKQNKPTHESKHLALLSLWRMRRAGAIKYASE